MSLNSLSGALLARLLKIPLILEYNGPEVYVQRLWGKRLYFEKVAKLIENANLRYANFIVTVSNALKDELIQRGVSPNKIICYPNCVDQEKYDPSRFTNSQLLEKRQELGFSENDVILTFVGSFGIWHGVEVLAHAIKKLFKNKQNWIEQNKVKFMLVGDGPSMDEVKRILSAIPHVERNVLLAGLVPQEKTIEYLAMSDILLSPHALSKGDKHFFGSPTKLFEYMAMEKIIIASNLGQIGEVLAPAAHINDIKSMNKDLVALLCDPGNVDQLVYAIEYACENYENLSFMGKNARKNVCKNYTWEKHVFEILKKINE